MKKIFLILFTFLLVVSFNSLADEYPERDIEVLCPWAAGGGADAITRRIGMAVDELIPTSVYVTNIEGGQSGFAAQKVMEANPDGYTFGTIWYDTAVTVPYEKLIPDFDIGKLKLIAKITAEDDAIVIRGDSKWETVEDFINDAKDHPGEIRMAMSGVGGRSHIYVLMMEEVLGVEFNKVAYAGGSGPKREAMLNGECDAAAMSYGDAGELLKSGELKPLVQLSTERNSSYPEAPTFEELGYEGLISSSFMIIAAPTGIPDEILDKIDKLFYDAQHSEEFRSWAESMGLSTEYIGMSEITEWLKNYQENAFEKLDDLKEKGII